MRNLKCRELWKTPELLETVQSACHKAHKISLFPVDQFCPFTWPSNLSVSWPSWRTWSSPFTNVNHRFQSGMFLHHFPTSPLTPQTPGAPSRVHSIKYLLSSSSGDTKMKETMPLPWRRGREKLLHYSTVSTLLIMPRCSRVEGVALRLTLQHRGRRSPGEGESHHSARRSLL